MAFGDVYNDKSKVTLSVGDVMIFPDEDEVPTGFAITRIEGNMAEGKITLENANGVPGPKKVISYTKVD